MGNYTKLNGYMSCETEEQLENIQTSWGSFCMPDFDIFFIIEKPYRGCINLHINPLHNSFKMLGYPDGFDEIIGYFETLMNRKFIEFFKINGFCEDDGIFEVYAEKDYGRIFVGSKHDDTKLFQNWHKETINNFSKRFNVGE